MGHRKRKRIKVAVISFNGLSPGGVESFLRRALCGLPSDKFEPTLFYCDLPDQSEYFGTWGTQDSCIEELLACKVDVRKFEVHKVNFQSKEREWIGTDLFDHFQEKEFDVLLTGRGGNSQFPYSRIHKIPIVDTIHLHGGLDLSANIMKSIHLNAENAQLYKSRGGLERDLVVMCPLVEDKVYTKESYRHKLGLENKIVIGMHQRNDDRIFSEIPLNSYSKIMGEYNVYFLMLNGSQRYREQASRLNIRNITFLPEAATEIEKQHFLNTLDIFAHGRFDGETNSAALVEAMRHAIPIVTHRSMNSNGQRDQVELCGFFAHNEDEYSDALSKLAIDEELRYASSQAVLLKFRSLYDIQYQIGKISREIEIAHEQTRNLYIKKWSYLSNFVARRSKRLFYHLKNIYRRGLH